MILQASRLIRASAPLRKHALVWPLPSSTQSHPVASTMNTSQKPRSPRWRRRHRPSAGLTPCTALCLDHLAFSQSMLRLISPMHTLASRPTTMPCFRHRFHCGPIRLHCTPSLQAWLLSGMLLATSSRCDTPRTEPSDSPRHLSWQSLPSVRKRRRIRKGDQVSISTRPLTRLCSRLTAVRYSNHGGQWLSLKSLIKNIKSRDIWPTIAPPLRSDLVASNFLLAASRCARRLRSLILAFL